MSELGSDGCRILTTQVIRHLGWLQRRPAETMVSFAARLAADGMDYHSTSFPSVIAMIHSGDSTGANETSLPLDLPKCSCVHFTDKKLLIDLSSISPESTTALRPNLPPRNLSFSHSETYVT